MLGLAISKMPRVFSLAGRILPLSPLQPMLAACLAGIQKRHPQIFDRLGPHSEKRYGLDTKDLPFAFLLEPRRLSPKVTAVRSLPRQIDVRITGSLAALIGLADGSCDGDALFFSRDLQIEGNTAAAVALRNAVDDAGIDIVAECVAWMGPLAPVVEGVVRDVIGKPLGHRRRNLSPEGASWN